MKAHIIILCMLLGITLGAKDFEVRGPEGGLAMKLTLPQGFDPEHDSCPMVILMHGIFSSKDFLPMPELAKSLAQNGIAQIYSVFKDTLNRCMVPDIGSSGSSFGSEIVPTYCPVL